MNVSAEITNHSKTINLRELIPDIDLQMPWSGEGFYSNSLIAETGAGGLTSNGSFSGTSPATIYITDGGFDS